jgi:TRAP-type mannitol/chloroaromatic compound transport system permease large subunit
MSLLVLTTISAIAAILLARTDRAAHLVARAQDVVSSPPTRRSWCRCAPAPCVAFVIAVVNKVTGLGLLSRMAERVTFVLIPPLLLIFLVLGTIFLGIATPTEGGAMGAIGALMMAWRASASSAAEAGAER